MSPAAVVKATAFYRLRDTNGDDQYDRVDHLKEIRGGGEHGPHGLRLTPDGKSIVLVAGNHTLPPEGFQASRVPKNWGEDQLLPRQWDANGHARGILAPGGWIARTDPDGKTWEILSSGYRNSYDIAYNSEGELFAYDSDMEWDMGMPWYRPTRAVHATSGSEFGWRSGTGKWPTYYVDSLPPLVNIGPGSPVGVTFGYGAKFPSKYQKMLYLCDWTFGTIYGLHLEPSGSTYKAVKEEFLVAHSPALDRHRRRSRRRVVLHRGRSRHAVGTVPRHLSRRRIDRAGGPQGTEVRSRTANAQEH